MFWTSAELYPESKHENEAFRKIISYFLQKSSSWMFDRVLNTPLRYENSKLRIITFLGKERAQ